jgi:hypothetical protein
MIATISEPGCRRMTMLLDQEDHQIALGNNMLTVKTGA